MNLNMIKILISTFLISIIFSLNPVSAEDNIIPIEKFAKRDSISNLSLSPDGKKLVLLRIPKLKANPVLEVYDTEDMTKAPFRMNSEKMELVSASWVSNSNLVTFFQQQVRDDIEGFNRGTYEYKLAKVDLDKNEIKEFKGFFTGITSELPKEPDHILISRYTSDRDRSESHYRLDLKTGKERLVIRESYQHRNIRFDADANPIFSLGDDRNNREQVYYVREPGKDDWLEAFRMPFDSFEGFSIIDFDPDKKNHILVIAHNGENTSGLWSYNYKKKKFSELIYRREDVDLFNVFNHSNYYKYPEKLAGFTYAKDKIYRVFLDGSEEAIYKQLESLIPNSHFVSIVSRSYDDKSFLVSNTAPTDPGTYYLIKKGKVSKVGVTQPELKYDKLANVEYVKYKSRHGEEMYAYVTIPQGKPPFPAIVMPHGGPFVDEVVIFDEWAQLLANYGYVVVQPQYRGSFNYGLEHHKKGFLPNGEGGKKMQDDKDDSVLHLVKTGLVDKDRIAMYGWSYGGYAALIAAAREEQIYQCAIAGAAVADMVYQFNLFKDRLIDGSAQQIRQTNYRNGSISPINEVGKVNIPLLMIHGTVDQRVPLDHAEKYMEKAKETGTKVKLITLDKADHFYSSLKYDHFVKLYSGIIDFLKNDCGPDGL